MAVKRKGGRGAKRRRARASTSWVLGRRSAPFLVEKPERHRHELGSRGALRERAARAIRVAAGPGDLVFLLNTLTGD